MHIEMGLLWFELILLRKSKRCNFYLTEKKKFLNNPYDIWLSGFLLLTMLKSIEVNLLQNCLHHVLSLALHDLFVVALIDT